MSETITETARREADEAEREELERDEADEELERDDEELERDADAEPEDAGEPASAPEPPSDVAAERAYKAIDRAAATYLKAVERVQERTSLGLVECPLCPVPGFVPVPAPPEMPEQVVLAVQSYLGGAEEHPRQHPDLERCPVCDGWGDMETGARRGDVLVKCPKCGGRGYEDKRQEQELDRMAAGAAPVVEAPPTFPALGSLAPPAGSQITQGGYTFVPIPGASADPHGRIAGHPLWGLHRDAGGL